MLVTRPRAQAETTAALLRAHGHEPRLFPLSTIEPLPFAAPPRDEVDALILTSANAAFALRHFRGLPVYAVGEATAIAARAHGAGRIVTAGGDWRSLAAVLRGSEGPRPGSRLLHLSGERVSGDLPGAAAAAGLGFGRLVVYAARPTAWLDAAVLALLRRQALDAVLFLSPANAATWRRLIERAACHERLFSVLAVALSPAVASALEPLVWRGVRIASAPEVASLLVCLEGPG